MRRIAVLLGNVRLRTVICCLLLGGVANFFVATFAVNLSQSVGPVIGAPSWLGSRVVRDSTATTPRFVDVRSFLEVGSAHSYAWHLVNKKEKEQVWGTGERGLLAPEEAFTDLPAWAHPSLAWSDANNRSVECYLAGGFPMRSSWVGFHAPSPREIGKDEQMQIIKGTGLTVPGARLTEGLQFTRGIVVPLGISWIGFTVNSLCYAAVLLGISAYHRISLRSLLIVFTLVAVLMYLAIARARALWLVEWLIRRALRDARQIPLVFS